MNDTNDIRALNKLYAVIDSESFSTDVSINGIDTGTQYGRINITDHLSAGIPAELSLDSVHGEPAGLLYSVFRADCLWI